MNDTTKPAAALDAHTFSKYCNYCQKHGHADSECWCTRAVPFPGQPFGLDIKMPSPPIPPQTQEAAIGISIQDLIAEHRKDPRKAAALDRAKARAVPEGQDWGFAMVHKTGPDRGLSWNANDPNFSEDWTRVPLKPATPHIPSLAERFGKQWEENRQFDLAAIKSTLAAAPQAEEVPMRTVKPSPVEGSFTRAEASAAVREVMAAAQASSELTNSERNQSLEPLSERVQPSIDTPEFRVLLSSTSWESRTAPSEAFETAINRLIAHIDAKMTQARDTRNGGRWVPVAERDEWKARADSAEEKLARIRALLDKE